jgi:hypothetical protein
MGDAQGIQKARPRRIDAKKVQNNDVYIKYIRK